MLEMFGTIAGNVLSLPGVLGLTLGLLTRRMWLAAFLGGLVGAVEALIFADFMFARLEGMELVISVLVGMVAGSIGSMIRRKGATV